MKNASSASIPLPSVKQDIVMIAYQVLICSMTGVSSPLDVSTQLLTTHSVLLVFLSIIFCTKLPIRLVYAS